MCVYTPSRIRTLQKLLSFSLCPDGVNPPRRALDSRPYIEAKQVTHETRIIAAVHTCI
jgi:hypothetical protein